MESWTYFVRHYTANTRPARHGAALKADVLVDPWVSF